MSLINAPLYGLRAQGGQHGTVATKPHVVTAMLDMVGYTPERDLSTVRLLDPAGGNGVFILEAIRRLSASAAQHGFSFAAAYPNLCVVEIDVDSVAALTNAIIDCLRGLGRLADLPNPNITIVHDDFLRLPTLAFDVVVGNPPYVRYDNVPADARDLYRQRYRTFSHRADLYVPFFEKGLRSLMPSGKLCYICPNRWLKNSYGQGLRGLIARGYTLSAVVDLETAQPFEEAVAAYPAIVLIENRWSDDPIRWSVVDDDAQMAIQPLPTSVVPRPTGHDWQHSFRGQHRSHTLQPIEAQGFKIGIGVATGADRIFMGTAFDVEQSCLLPILTARDLRGNRLAWSGQYVINPFEADGQLVDLADYPRLARYLNTHRSALSQRHVARKNPVAWYRTIDRIDPTLTAQPKLLLPDMSANNRLLLDEGHYYPHHNLYYITSPDMEALKILGTLLMTPDVREQLARLSTRMNGGYLRWQSQHLRKLLITRVNSLSQAEKQDFVKRFEEGNMCL